MGARAVGFVALRTVQLLETREHHRLRQAAGRKQLSADKTDKNMNFVLMLVAAGCITAGSRYATAARLPILQIGIYLYPSYKTEHS